ncbi:hypothetical protein ACPCTH_33530 [Streptomyces cellulosae]
MAAPLPPLATVEDAKRLGYDLDTATATELLERASVRLRRAAGQTITPTSAVVRLGVADGGWVRLPAPPVRKVLAVRAVHCNTVTPITVYCLDEDVIRGLGDVMRVEVEYERGFDPVPAGIVELCCQVAYRMQQTVPGMEFGIRQQSIDNYSVTFAVEQIDAAGNLLPGELTALQSVLGTRGVWVVNTV